MTKDLLDAARLASGIAPNRVSTEQDDPGYRAWCILSGDGYRVKVLLDGQYQPDAFMADSAKGLIKRNVRTPEGNLAIDHHRGEFLYETVSGCVSLVVYRRD